MTAILGLASTLILCLALALVLIRLFRGPTGFDRLLAAETLALGLIGLLMLRSQGEDVRFYTDAALGLALFSFVGVVVFAELLEREAEDD